MKLVLVRHAEATCNLSAGGAPMAGYDEGCDLTGEGLRQAGLLALHFPRELTPFALHASPLRRAARTAALLGDAFGAPVVCDQRLAELRAPRFDPPITGARWDQLLAERRVHPGREVLPGLESVASHQRRVRGALAALCDRPDSVAVVVTHAFTIELALAELLRLEDSWLREERIKISHTALFVLELEPGRPARLALANGRAHLGRFS